MGMLNKKDYTKWKPGDKVKPKTTTGPGLTKQEFGPESDINNIMKRYAPNVRDLMGYSPDAVFGDVSKVQDFAETLRMVHSAEDAFAALPAAVRSRFHNDPVELVEFVQRDENYDEAVKLGLIMKKEEPAPAPTPTPTPKASETPKA